MFGTTYAQPAGPVSGCNRTFGVDVHSVSLSTNFFSSTTAAAHATAAASSSSSVARPTASVASSSTSAPAATSVLGSDGYCAKCQTHHKFICVHNKRFAYSQECTGQRQQILPIMLVGDAGTAVGSRLKGHTRRGGTKLRKWHMRQGPVALTDEFRTSKTCVFCFRPVELARSRRIVNGVAKIVRVNGAVVCLHPDCVSYKAGYCTKGRDAHAALNIALAGATRCLHPSGTVLSPYSRVRINTTPAPITTGP